MRRLSWRRPRRKPSDSASLFAPLSVLGDGLEAALKQAGAHDCVACASPCMIETNATFAFHPRVLLNHISALWNRRIY